jgi:hypothetical protein
MRHLEVSQDPASQTTAQRALDTQAHAIANMDQIQQAEARVVVDQAKTRLATLEVLLTVSLSLSLSLYPPTYLSIYPSIHLFFFQAI